MWDTFEWLRKRPILCTCTEKHALPNMRDHCSFVANTSHICIHLAIQNSVTSFASSTSPISSRSCVVPRTADSSADQIHYCKSVCVSAQLYSMWGLTACVNEVCSPTNTVCFSVWKYAGK